MYFPDWSEVYEEHGSWGPPRFNNTVGERSFVQCSTKLLKIWTLQVVFSFHIRNKCPYRIGKAHAQQPPQQLCCTTETRERRLRQAWKSDTNKNVIITLLSTCSTFIVHTRTRHWPQELQHTQISSYSGHASIPNITYSISVTFWKEMRSAISTSGVSHYIEPDIESEHARVVPNRELEWLYALGTKMLEGGK